MPSRGEEKNGNTEKNERDKNFFNLFPICQQSVTSGLIIVRAQLAISDR